jgi:lipopolysaccharide/colanic/teichoic acid biosynthesis glycosyltransferase
MKYRFFDLVLSIPFVILFFIPCVILLLIKWLEDKRNPIYVAKRVTKDGRVFSMYKIRTMIPDAHLLGGTSTANSDQRITPVGRFFRSCKLDEFPQLLNVIKGDLSLVGVRPTTTEEYASFSDYEKESFSMKAGLTDLSSIFFSDEGDILNNSKDPDSLYQAYIRPKKSQLGVLSVRHSNITFYFQIIFLTCVNFLNRKITLKMLLSLLTRINAPQDVLQYVNETFRRINCERSA